MRIRRRLVPLLVASAVMALVTAAPSVAGEDDGKAPKRLPAGIAVDPSAPALPTDLTAAAWVVADAETGEVLAAQDAHAEHAPASTLKVLTALALLPAVPPSTVVTPTQAEVEVEGSKVGLLRDVPYPAEELYASLIMVSGNDAANALAGAAGGQVAAAALMNAKARELGAVDTRAVNPHGLDAQGQVSTPYDLATVGRAALRTPDLARWAVTTRGTMTGKPGEPRFEIHNHNKLLGDFDGALGIKNGYTVASRASFIGAAERDGRTLVVALMRAEPRVWAEAGRLLEWGFGAAAAGADPVGALPAPPAGPAADSGAEGDAEQDQDTTTVDLTPAGSGSAAGTPGPPQLPGRQLAAGLLVVGAVLAVRPSRRRALTL
jgi:D-alanyl-D-alanine carboxypeptidase (penicillin-binding protein 5/6)